MATNRRRDGGAGFARACKAALMCALLAAAGIGYVRQTMEQDRLGGLVKQQEEKITRLKAERINLLGTQSIYTSNEALLERVRFFNLNLKPATPQQRLYVAVPAPHSLAIVIPPEVRSSNVLPTTPSFSRAASPGYAETQLRMNAVLASSRTAEAYSALSQRSLHP